MAPSILPRRRETIISIALLAVFFVGMNPPAIEIFNQATTVGGFGMLYVWLVVMSAFVSLSLAWAARNDAFALTERNVPPELREKEDIVTVADEPDVEEPAPGGE